MFAEFCQTKSMFRVVFSILLGALLPEWALAAAQRPSPVARPNIILVLADDLGYGDLGCYGQEKIKTPNLDKMAAEGIRFTQAYAGSTVCAPSRCALMTGLHTGHALIRGNAKVPLRPEDVTIAETLKAAGYYTTLIGKWGLGNEDTTGTPRKKGFNDFLGYLDQVHAHNYYPDNIWRYDPGNDFEGKIELSANAEGKQGTYSHDLFTTAALNSIGLRKPEALNRFRPFFLFLAYTIPHANNEEGRRSGNGMQVPSTDPYSNEPWPDPEKGKAAMITRMDQDIGKLFSKLAELGIDESTMVIFTSDNGPHKEGGVDPKFFKSSGPLKGIKRDLYEGGIRVPMLVRWPGKVKAGQTSDVPWGHWDIPATLAQAAGVTNPPAGDGLSFLPTILGKEQTNRHEFLYWEFHEKGFKQAVRMGDWKAVKAEGKPMELYNLKADLSEERNLAGQNAEVVAKIEKYLAGARTESTEWPGPAKK
jgi:arylsulfatase A-like enzyme